MTKSNAASRKPASHRPVKSVTKPKPLPDPRSPDNRYKEKLSARKRRDSPNPKTPPKAPKVDNPDKRKSGRLPNLRQAPDLSSVRMAKGAKSLLGALCDFEINGMFGI